MLSPCCHRAFRAGALCRRLAVRRRQRFFELLFDAEGVGGGARPEFPQRMPVALAPCDQSLRVFPALTEEGDDAIGQLAKGHRVEGRGVEPVDDERAVAADPFEVFAKVAPSAAAWAGFRVSAACSISSPTKVLLRSSGQPLLPAGDARDREPLPVGVLPDPDGATDEAGGFVSALRTS
jgi:hypothetical protein